MSTKPEIETSLVVGMAHVRRWDYDYLSDYRPERILVHPFNEFGSAWIYVEQDEDAHLQWLWEQSIDHDFPDSPLKDLLLWARELKVDWLRIVEDGPIYDQFPVFDWDLTN